MEFMCEINDKNSYEFSPTIDKTDITWVPYKPSTYLASILARKVPFELRQEFAEYILQNADGVKTVETLYKKFFINRKLKQNN